MVLILPFYTGFDTSTVHDIAVRIGNDFPDATTGPDTINTLCNTVTGVLSTELGAIVRVECQNAPVIGRVATVQIRWGEP